MADPRDALKLQLLAHRRTTIAANSPEAALLDAIELSITDPDRLKRIMAAAKAEETAAPDDAAKSG